MFLNKTIEKNKKLIDFAIQKHKENVFVPNTYVIDFDSMMQNAKKMIDRANEYGIEMFYMAKQYGRIPELGRELEKMGYKGAVVVDHQGFEIALKNKLKVVHVGHLSQVPNAYIDKVIDNDVEYVTFYSLEKMAVFNAKAKAKNKKIKAIIKVIEIETDVIYESQVAGFTLREIEENIDIFKSFENIEITAVTSFPCFIRNDEKNTEAPTGNLYTLIKAKEIFAKHKINVLLNTPSSTSFKTLESIKKYGGKHGEPGHALTGTVRSVASNDQFTEIPSMIYVSEISHNFKNKSYAFGGGNYGRGGLENALVGTSINGEILKVSKIEPYAIDYYFELNKNSLVGETVTMSFRTQIFMTRSKVAVVKGLSTNKPEISGIYDNLGNKLDE